MDLAFGRSRARASLAKMTRDVKYLVLALAMAATAGAVAPPSLRGVKDASGAETVGDTFEMSLAKAVAENDAAVAVETPKLRGAAEGGGERPRWRRRLINIDRRARDELTEGNG